MICVSCCKNRVEQEGEYNCNDCFLKATGIDRKTGKVDFRYSKTFKNPYAVENILETPVEAQARKEREKIASEKKKKFTRKAKQMTTSTDYGKMMDEIKENPNPLCPSGDCSDLSISNNNASGHRPDCVCMQCAKKKQVK